MKYLILACLVVLAAAESPVAVEPAPVLDAAQLTQLLQQLSTRAARVGGYLQKFKTTGVEQIRKLAKLISDNQGCAAMSGITAPEIPTPPPEEEEEPLPTDPLTLAEASQRLHDFSVKLTALEHRIVKMNHVGATQIEMFSRFTEATGGKLCDSESSEETEGDD